MSWIFNHFPQLNGSAQKPVVRLASETDQRELTIMRWGLIPFCVLVEGFQDRLFRDQREGGNCRHQPDIPRGTQAPSLPGSDGLVFRIGATCKLFR